MPKNKKIIIALCKFLTHSKTGWYAGVKRSAMSEGVGCSVWIRKGKKILKPMKGFKAEVVVKKTVD